MRHIAARHPVACIAAFVAVLLSAQAAAGQIPTEFRNLQVLPEDISRDSLVLLMRSFSFATGLRCEGCHVLGDNGSFEGARFDLDEKTNKHKARFMIQMVNRINQSLSDLPGRNAAPLAVECKTCHRGLARPFLLRTELHRVLDDFGVDSAIARYRFLRQTAVLHGTYDFGEWEMNELAREVEADGNLEAAIALLDLNAEFHPNSTSIQNTLGRLHEQLGQRDRAIAAYRRVLELDPDNQNARQRLDALTGRSVRLEPTHLDLSRIGGDHVQNSFLSTLPCGLRFQPMKFDEPRQSTEGAIASSTHSSQIWTPLHCHFRP